MLSPLLPRRVTTGAGGEKQTLFAALFAAMAGAPEKTLSTTRQAPEIVATSGGFVSVPSAPEPGAASL